METIEETRRELFEAWFESLNHRKPELQYGMAGHYYLDQRTDDAWWGFNAALDAVAIKLPPPCQEKTVGPNPLRSNYAVGWDDCRVEMAKRIGVEP